MKMVKLKDAPKPDSLFYSETKLKTPDQLQAMQKKIDAKLAEVKKKRANATTKYKAIQAISKELDGNLKNILKRITDAEISIQGYLSSLESVEEYLQEGSKSGDVTFRRSNDHLKALKNMYKQWEKAEAAGDARKSEIAGNAYIKAVKNASSDFGLAAMYIQEASKGDSDKWFDDEFDANIETLKAALQAILNSKLIGTKSYESIETKVNRMAQVVEAKAREKARWAKFR